MATYPRGIDVSNHQGAIDWDAVAGGGVQFAISKASEGTYFRDGWFAENWAECERVGIARGAYHYAVPSRYGAVEEAEYFVGSIEALAGPLEPGDLLALDLEDPQAFGDLADWTIDWLERVAALVGFRPLVYTSPAYAASRCLYNRPEIGEYGLWVASWGVPTPPPAPAPWTLVAIHQIGVGPPGTVPGVAGAIDVDRFNGSSVEQLKLYGKPAGAPVQPPAALPPAGLPVYDWTEPSRLQELDSDCSVESIEWCLYSWGRTPDDDWMERSMLEAGVWNPSVGCTDASGAGLARWVNEQYGADGYVASNQATDFDTLAAEAATLAHPLAAGGAAFYHWVGVRNYDPKSDALILANPAPGYQGVGDVLPRWRFAELGPWHLVRVTHPAAEGQLPPPDPGPEPTPPPSIWTETIGSGLLQMMDDDESEPAQSASVWVGGPPAEVEQCYGKNGVLYVWILSEARGFRIKPS